MSAQETPGSVSPDPIGPRWVGSGSVGPTPVGATSQEASWCGEPTAERLARVALSLLCVPGSTAVARAVGASGAERALALVGAKVREQGSDVPSLVEAADRLAAAARSGIRFVVPGDPGWPARLDDLDRHRFVRDRGWAGPVGLWVAGDADLAGLVEQSVALVGTRAPSDYGAHMAAELATGLGDAGWATVSGAAYGIDAAAHRGSLAAGAPTVAVLAGGVDVRYPAGNSALLDRVAACGAIVSEVPPGCAPTRGRFLVRNRLIAALSQATVIVEAGLRSGARNTMGHARALGRQLLAVPGLATSPVAAGALAELKADDTSVATSAADVLEAVAKVGEHLVPHASAPAGPRDGLEPLAAAVLDAVPVRSGRPSGAIARTAGQPAVETAVALSRLEARGLVERDDTGYRLTALARAPVARPQPPAG